MTITDGRVAQTASLAMSSAMPSPIGGWTHTGVLRRHQVVVSMICGVLLNVTAVATFAVVLLDGPYWLVAATATATAVEGLATWYAMTHL